LRVDKATLAALAATLALYLEPERLGEIPFYAMLAATPDALRARAERLRGALEAYGVATSVVPTLAFAGGGTLPLASIASIGLRLDGELDPDRRARELRAKRPALAGRIEDGALLFDLRTLPPERDDEIVRLLVAAN
jgi:L-seryl-tRNA(Ser) seleniumtransferase